MCDILICDINYSYSYIGTYPRSYYLPIIFTIVSSVTESYTCKNFFSNLTFLHLSLKINL